MEKKVIRAALLGLGTVGTGVYKVIKNQKEEMIPKLGSEIEISKILVRNLEKAAAKVDDPKILTNNWDDIVNDPEIDVVIELIGGIEPAKTYILSARGFARLTTRRFGSFFLSSSSESCSSSS